MVAVLQPSWLRGHSTAFLGWVSLPQRVFRPMLDSIQCVILASVRSLRRLWISIMKAPAKRSCPYHSRKSCWSCLPLAILQQPSSRCNAVSVKGVSSHRQATRCWQVISKFEIRGHLGVHIKNPSDSPICRSNACLLA